MSIDAGLRAVVSLGAIARNVQGMDRVDLRRDAFGHGFGAVCATVLEASGARILADLRDLASFDPGSDRIVAQDDGFPDPTPVFGLDGGGVPALAAFGTVLTVKVLRAGEGVSYGYTHVAGRDSRVALVSGGYAQGVVRALGNQASVVIGGHAFPIVGRVAMDACVVDIADADVRRGEEVMFIGARRPAASAADWAALTGLSALEIVSVLGMRTERTYAP